LRKWAIAGMLYITVVIFGFEAYDRWIAEEDVTEVQAGMEEMGSMDEENNEEENLDDMESGEDMEDMESMEVSNHGGEEAEGSHGHETGSSNSQGSQVNAFVTNDENNIKIYLKDKIGSPIDSLEINHEKIFHLIIVDEQLQKYYHVHPERTAAGEFTTENNLPDGYYKAFIDIKPTTHSYEVEPIPFVVGTPTSETHGHSLVPDTAFTKTVEGEEVTLSVSSFKAGEDVKLSFELDKTNLTPYLGAMGHVVILDEYGKEFLHVHPSNDKDTIFETKFDQPGIYKIWAEFQQNGKVRAFPYVIEITE
jgi:P-type Cu+ transporter